MNLVASESSPAPDTEPYLPREALLALMVAPPAVALMIADVSGTPTIADGAGCVLAVWIGTVAAGIVVHMTVNFVARRLFPTRTPRWMAHCALACVAMASTFATLRVLLPRLGALSAHLAANLPPTYARSIALAAFYVVAARAYGFLSTRARRASARERAQKQAALRARLEALQARTNPHFLFNSLNAIASLIPIDPERAEGMVERLAGVLQYSLASGARGSVSLGEELSAVRDYLDIEQARFGARLRSRIDVASELESISIPPMLLQPLVENAVLHGLAGRAEGGEVVVSARSVANATVLTVSDDGVGDGGSTRRGTQLGLRGTRERLALMYGDAATMEVRERVGGGFECELRVPKRVAA